LFHLFIEDFSKNSFLKIYCNLDGVFCNLIVEKNSGENIKITDFDIFSGI